MTRERGGSGDAGCTRAPGSLSLPFVFPFLQPKRVAAAAGGQKIIRAAPHPPPRTKSHPESSNHAPHPALPRGRTPPPAAPSYPSVNPNAPLSSSHDNHRHTRTAHAPLTTHLSPSLPLSPTRLHASLPITKNSSPPPHLLLLLLLLLLPLLLVKTTDFAHRGDAVVRQGVFLTIRAIQLLKKEAEGRPILVGIAGPSGAGKTVGAGLITCSHSSPCLLRFISAV